MASEYLGSGVVNFDIRPLRFAYVIHEGSREDFARAVAEASSRWGGMQEPILLAAEDGALLPRSKALLDQFPPDHFVAAGTFSRDAMARLEQAVGAPVIPILRVDTGAEGIHQLCAVSQEEIRALRLSVASEDASVGMMAAAGVLAPPEVSEWRKLGAVVNPTAEWSDLAVDQFFERTVIGTTVRECSEQQLSSYPGGITVVWLADPNSLDDAVRYWNTRALAPRAIPSRLCFVPPEIARTTRFRAALEAAVASIPIPVTPEVFICSLTVPIEERHAVAADLGLAHQKGPELTLEFRSGFRAGGPISYKATVDPVLIQGGRRVAGKRSTAVVQLDRQETIVRVESPITFNPRFNGAVRVRISGPSQLNLPSGHSVARLFEDHGVEAGGFLELTMNTVPTYELRIRIPEPAAVLRASLQDRGVGMSPSDKGQLASGVLQLVGNPQILRGVSAMEVINALTTHRLASDVRKLRQELGEAVPEAALEDLARQLRDVRQVARPLEDIASRMSIKPSEVATTLEQMVAAGIILRGLMVNCGVCGMRTFVELSSARAGMPCPGCGGAAAFVVRPERGETALHYRLNALVDRASEQGVMSHLIGAAVLSQTFSGIFVMPGANLTLSGGEPTEVDLLTLWDGRIGCGEAKLTAKWFTEVQIAKDLRAAVGIGAETYFMVCLEAIPAEVRALAYERCQEANVRLVSVEGPEGRLSQGAVRGPASHLSDEVDDIPSA
jgi:DNA-binding Lrp family transcriptional regulator